MKMSIVNWDSMQVSQDTGPLTGPKLDGAEFRCRSAAGLPQFPCRKARPNRRQAADIRDSFDFSRSFSGAKRHFSPADKGISLSATGPTLTRIVVVRATRDPGL
jgi:hypothetical protein